MISETSSYIRNKITGEIRTVYSRCTDNTIETVDKGGHINRMKIKDFNSPPDDWEYIFYDYEKLTPYIVNFYESSIFGQRLLDIFARRIDNDYFKVGCIVKIIDSFYKPEKFYYSNPEKESYIIQNIRADRHDEGKYFVDLAINPGSDKAIGTGETCFSIPIYVDRIVEHDAFVALKRFDKPY